MSSSTTPKTILLRGHPAGREAIAVAAVTPGHLGIIDSAGKIKVHNTAKGVANKIFVREEEYVGGSIDTAYAIADQVPYWDCKPGDQIYGWLKTGSSVAVGAFLESGGDGSLQALTAQSQGATTPFPVTTGGYPVARALETVDNSGGGTGPSGAARIKLEVL